jgi:ATP-dependent Clp endopeptidase proteolytic subunit ClpP
MSTYPIRCRIRAEAAVTRVDVYDDIGEGGWFAEGLTAKDFTARMAGITGAVECHVNSGGGDVFDGIAIANALRAHKGDVTTVVDGIAASIASVIAQAGRKRVMQANSMMMIHDAFGLCMGNAAEMAAMAETLGKVSDNIADVYASRSGRGTAATWRDAMKAESWYTADEAVTAGLADQVGDGSAELPAGVDLAAFTAVPGRIAARLRSMPQAKAPARPVNADAPEGDGAQDKAPRLPRDRQGRVLGMESMPLADKALPVHHTATTDEAWDGPAAVAAMPADDTVLRYCHAWESDEAASVPHREGDADADDRKGNYKFPHHKADGGPANLAACRNGLARLSAADIPADDDAGVKAHLQAHLADGGQGDDDDSADDRAHPDLSGLTPEQIRAAVRGAAG